MSKSRLVVSVALAGVLVAAGLAAAPAFAEDPPLTWTQVSSTTTGDGVTVTWETSSADDSPFGGTTMIDPMPILRPQIVNDSLETKYFGFGTDFVTQGTIDPLWTSGAWGAFDTLIADGGVLDNFWVELPAGASLSDGVTAGGGDEWYTGMPSWSGHTVTVFELDASPAAVATPGATALASYSTGGRFVGADLSNGDVDNISAVLGERATVSGAGGTPELFAGLTATVEAPNLTPGDTLELWIAKDLNYAIFQILGGGLPVGAIKVGEGTVAADRTLTAPFVLPSGLALGNYQLVVGVRGERYWPAGTYDDFQVTTPTTTNSATSSGAGTVPVVAGPTTVTMTYPSGTTAGTTTVTVSGTGPAIDGFQLVSEPRLYYHIDTTATLGGPATVCITFDPSVLSPYPPQLFHFDTTVTPARWVDITTSRSSGQVCGLTSSFSPFVIGYEEPETFDFTGFFSPVSMTADNIAKAGQAIPVKFSLDGDQGLEVVESARFVIEGTDTTPEGQAVPVTTAGASGLTYNAASDTYTYVWKTNKAWSLKTGRFEVSLSDGTVHSFHVTFKK